MPSQSIRIWLLILCCATVFLVKNTVANTNESKNSKSSTLTKKQQLMALELTAGLGDPIDIYNLAHNYHHGTYSDIDLKKAKLWYTKAASTAVPAIRYKIGRMYELGIIFEKSREQALSHYHFAAKGEDIFAQTNLGALYLSDKDEIEQGIYWSKKAAESNSIEAQVNLAIAYQRGLSGKVDVEQAIYWFKAAAANNNPYSQHQLGLYYYSIKNYDDAFYWFDLASELKNDNAMLYLSMMFDKGLGTEKNRKKAITLLEASAELGNKKAKTVLKQLFKPESK